jgi:hypothetical protein
MALEELEELDNNHNISNAEAKAALAVSNALAYVTAAENVLVKGEIAIVALENALDAEYEELNAAYTLADLLYVLGEDTEAIEDAIYNLEDIIEETEFFLDEAIIALDEDLISQIDDAYRLLDEVNELADAQNGEIETYTDNLVDEAIETALDASDESIDAEESADTEILEAVEAQTEANEEKVDAIGAAQELVNALSAENENIEDIMFNALDEANEYIESVDILLEEANEALDALNNAAELEEAELEAINESIATATAANEDVSNLLAYLADSEAVHAETLAQITAAEDAINNDLLPQEVFANELETLIRAVSGIEEPLPAEPEQAPEEFLPAPFPPAPAGPFPPVPGGPIPGQLAPQGVQLAFAEPSGLDPLAALIALLNAGLNDSIAARNAATQEAITLEDIATEKIAQAVTTQNSTDEKQTLAEDALAAVQIAQNAISNTNNLTLGNAEAKAALAMSAASMYVESAQLLLDEGNEALDALEATLIAEELEIERSEQVIAELEARGMDTTEAEFYLEDAIDAYNATIDLYNGALDGVTVELEAELNNALALQDTIVVLGNPEAGVIENQTDVIVDIANALVSDAAEAATDAEDASTDEIEEAVLAQEDAYTAKDAAETAYSEAIAILIRLQQRPDLLSAEYREELRSAEAKVILALTSGASYALAIQSLGIETTEAKVALMQADAIEDAEILLALDALDKAEKANENIDDGTLALATAQSYNSETNALLDEVNTAIDSDISPQFLELHAHKDNLIDLSKAMLGLVIEDLKGQKTELLIVLNTMLDAIDASDKVPAPVADNFTQTIEDVVNSVNLVALEVKSIIADEEVTYEELESLLLMSRALTVQVSGFIDTSLEMGVINEGQSNQLKALLVAVVSEAETVIESLSDINNPTALNATLLNAIVVINNSFDIAKTEAIAIAEYYIGWLENIAPDAADDHLMLLNEVGNVGYYDMQRSQGYSRQVESIENVNKIAVNVMDISSEELAGLDVLYVQNPSNGGYNSEYRAQLSNVEEAVSDGLTLIMHDRYVSGAAAILPGGDDIVAVRDFTKGREIEIVDGGAGLEEGVGGVLDDDSLDGAHYSNHGYIEVTSLPENATVLLTNGNANEAVTVSYSYGEGTVIYSTILLDYYLGTTNDGVYEDVFENMNIYAANLLEETVNRSVELITDEATSITIDVLLNDNDQNGFETLYISDVDASPSAGGSVTIEEGTLIFNPGNDFDYLDKGESQSVSFDYTISDEYAETDSATVTLTVYGIENITTYDVNENTYAGTSSSSDLLLVDTDDITLDFDTINMSNIEIIDLNDGSQEVVNLSLADVLASDTDSLKIMGDASDVVSLDETVWTEAPVSDELGYRQYTSAGDTASVYIQQDILVTFDDQGNPLV